MIWETPGAGRGRKVGGTSLFMEQSINLQPLPDPFLMPGLYSLGLQTMVIKWCSGQRCGDQPAMCWSHAQGSILAARLILESSTLATNVHLPFIYKLHWAAGITVNWRGSGLSHRQTWRAERSWILHCHPVGPGQQRGFVGFRSCSHLDLTLHLMSSPSVSDAEAMPDLSVGKLEQGVWGWGIQLGKVDRAWKQILGVAEGKKRSIGRVVKVS